MSVANQKTTLYLDPVEYRRLRALARATKRKPAALIREAVAEFNARHAAKQKPRSIGVGRSGRGDISERAEALLKGMGRAR